MASRRVSDDHGADRGDIDRSGDTRRLENGSMAELKKGSRVTGDDRSALAADLKKR